MNEPLDITTLTLEQLKALAYDQLLIREQAQANLNALNAEIQKRAQANVTTLEAEIAKREKPQAE